MVGDADLQIYPDRNSMSWDDTRPLVESIWGTAQRLGVVEFVMDHRYDVVDDHIQLHDIGQDSQLATSSISTIRDWHTQGDTPDRCSALSLAKVGWVICEWLKHAVTGEKL